MLDYAIAFALGLVLATLAALAMVPAIWARARRLLRREMEAALPISMAEVRASQDQVRAEAAITQRRLELALDRAREQRHLLMVDQGRLSERLRQVQALIGVDAARIKTTEDASALIQRDILAAQQESASLKAELAAARVMIALRDDEVGEFTREIDTRSTESDNLRIELAAAQTRLGSAEEDAGFHKREMQRIQNVVAEQNERLAVQAIELMRRETAIAAVESRAASLQRDVQSLSRRHDDRLELENRVSTLGADLRRKDAALAERDARLAIASGREAELTAELNRVKRGMEPDAAATEIATLRNERAHLRAELASLRQEAHDSWMRIEADNRMLRREMAQIAADIAREVAVRQSAGAVAAQERVAANDQAAAQQDQNAADGA